MKKSYPGTPDWTTETTQEKDPSPGTDLFMRSSLFMMNTQTACPVQQTRQTE